MNFKYAVIPVVCNIVWSFHPLFGKWILEDFHPVHGALLRYWSAAISFAALAFLLRKFRRPRIVQARDGFLIALIGLLTFSISPALQMTGLQSTQAVDNAIIVAMEPLITLFLAALFLGERPSLRQTLSLLTALGGFALLSGLTPSRLQGSFNMHLWGNILILISMFGEATFSVAGRSLIHRYSATGLTGISLVVGVGFLTLYAVPTHGLPDLTRLEWKHWIAILWLGPLGTAGGYFLWMSVLRHVTVSTAVLSLFLQPVLGALWGFLFLQESLDPIQMAGGGLILLAVLGQHRWREAGKADAQASKTTGLSF